MPLLTVDGLSLSLPLVSDMNMESPVGPFLFLGNWALTTFDSFHFRVATPFVEHIMGVLGLPNVDVMLGSSFFFCHVTC